MSALLRAFSSAVERKEQLSFPKPEPRWCVGPNVVPKPSYARSTPTAMPATNPLASMPVSCVSVAMNTPPTAAAYRYDTQQDYYVTPTVTTSQASSGSSDDDETSMTVVSKEPQQQVQPPLFQEAAVNNGSGVQEEDDDGEGMKSLSSPSSVATPPTVPALGISMSQSCFVLKNKPGTYTHDPYQATVTDEPNIPIVSTPMRHDPHNMTMMPQSLPPPALAAPPYLAASVEAPLPPPPPYAASVAAQQRRATGPSQQHTFVEGNAYKMMNAHHAASASITAPATLDAALQSGSYERRDSRIAAAASVDANAAATRTIRLKNVPPIEILRNHGYKRERIDVVRELVALACTRMGEPLGSYSVKPNKKGPEFFATFAHAETAHAVLMFYEHENTAWIHGTGQVWLVSNKDSGAVERFLQHVRKTMNPDGTRQPLKDGCILVEVANSDTRRPVRQPNDPP